MGHPPLSPASSTGGLASLERFTDLRAGAPQLQSCVAPAEIYRAFNSDPSRFHPTIYGEGLVAHTPRREEQAPPMGHLSPNASTGFKREQEDHSSFVHPPFTPEMSPLELADGDSIMATPCGLGASKRHCSAASRRAELARVEKRQLHKPLSEYIKETGDADVFDVFAHVHRETRRKEVGDDGKVKRPLNAFLLYRKHVIVFVKKKLLSEENKNNQQLLSRICGDSWKIETDEVKARFKKLAQEEKTRHGQAFPTYKYTPKTVKRPENDGGGDLDRNKSATVGGRSADGSGLGVPGGLSSSLGAGEPVQPSYGFLHSQAAGAEAHAQHDPHGEGTYCCSSGVEPAADMYGHGQLCFPGYHYDAGAAAEFGYGWAQAGMPPVGTYAMEAAADSQQRQLAGAPAADLYIDPSLLPRMDHPVYHWHADDGGALQGQQGWPPHGNAAGDMLVAMPDLDINGAHNAYLRGAQEDWEVEPLGEAGHFGDWMMQEENA